MPTSARRMRRDKRVALQRVIALENSPEPQLAKALDLRTGPGKLFKEIYPAILEQSPHLGIKGALVAEHVTWMHMMLQSIEVSFAKTGQIDITGYTQLNNSLVASLRLIGVNRVTRSAKTLDEIVAEAGKNAPEHS